MRGILAFDVGSQLSTPPLEVIAGREVLNEFQLVRHDGPATRNIRNFGTVALISRSSGSDPELTPSKFQACLTETAPPRSPKVLGGRARRARLRCDRTRKKCVLPGKGSHQMLAESNQGQMGLYPLLCA